MPYAHNEVQLLGYAKDKVTRQGDCFFSMEIVISEWDFQNKKEREIVIPVTHKSQVDHGVVKSQKKMESIQPGWPVHVRGKLVINREGKLMVSATNVQIAFLTPKKEDTSYSSSSSESDIDEPPF